VDERSVQAKDILERILTSYGFTSRQQYSETVGVPLGTIGNWISRNSIPGDYVIRCALDTGEDLHWLMSGELKKASSVSEYHLPKGRELYEKVMSNGGRPVLTRMLSAYGFSMQKELGDLLNISSGTMSAWIRREYFPGDVVVACALETGASLRWLAIGEGKPFQKGLDEPHIEIPGLINVAKYVLMNGVLINDGISYFDINAFPHLTKDDSLVTDGKKQWYINLKNTTIGNGLHLLDIDGYLDIYDVSRLPENKIRVTRDGVSFECPIDAVRCAGIVRATITIN